LSYIYFVNLLVLFEVEGPCSLKAIVTEDVKTVLQHGSRVSYLAHIEVTSNQFIGLRGQKLRITSGLAAPWSYRVSLLSGFSFIHSPSGTAGLFGLQMRWPRCKSSVRYNFHSIINSKCPINTPSSFIRHQKSNIACTILSVL
jgi:hypothetical protein